MRILLIVFMLVVLGACGAAGTEDAPGEVSPLGDWQLASGDVDGTPIPIVDDHRITLSFTESEFGGTAACNGYGGTYGATGGDLQLGAIAATEMACLPPVMESEASYLAALQRVTGYSAGEQTLQLTGDAVTLEFTRLEQVPTAALADTVWQLDTLIEGEVATSVGGEPATLELRSDGTLVGGTGCRTLEGTWIESGDTIQFIDFAADGDCPADLQDQDAHIVTVLGDGFTFEIEGSRLTVSAPGRIGLSYEAR